ncbi:MAG: hypothetical protein QM831_33170 [Kofleriaceae bacterium]
MRWLLLALVGCASALGTPQPISTMAHASGRSADDLVKDGDAAIAARDFQKAQELYLDAAGADETRVDAVIGAMKAIAWRIEHEKVDKLALAEKEVSLGQWCGKRAPGNAECDYRLAIAIGQQARERTATGKDAMDRMVALLKNASKKAPELDGGAPHRVLAIVYLRAPAWPMGPGDPEAALDEAKAAVTIKSTAENQLTLGEAYAANDQTDAAKQAYGKALGLARESKDPDAGQWAKQAEEGLRK